MMFYKEAGKPLSISEIVSIITGRIENDNQLKRIKVQGELGNFKMHSTAWYFSLKDKNSTIPCVMWPFNNQNVSFTPHDGDMLEVICDVKVYQRESRVQLYVYRLEKAGQGDFYAQFQRTREKLEPLGYFAEEHKKPIPPYPQQISVITAPGADALGDIRITIANRWPSVRILEVYATVQGANAPQSLIEAVRTADQQGSDVIILARGGGTVDDLWCFNDEKLAIAIYQCNTPVITGVGHEYDTTIVDFVAEKRAATPTAAAQAATPNWKEVLAAKNSMLNTIINAVNRKYDNNAQAFEGYRTKLEAIEHRVSEYSLKVRSCNSLIRLATDRLLSAEMQKLDHLHQRMRDSAELLISNQENRKLNLINEMTRQEDKLLAERKVLLQGLNAALQQHSPVHKAELYISKKKRLLEIMSVRMNNRLSFSKAAFDSTLKNLVAVNPLSVMERGYAVTSQNGQVVTSVDQVTLNKKMNIRYLDGTLGVIPVERNRNNG